MPRRARISLIGAGAATVGLALVWLLAHDVPVARRADLAVLAGFAELGRPWVDAVTGPVARLCDPSHYVVLVAVPIVVALARRRPRVAVVLAGVLLGANATTEVLKPLLAAPRGEISAVWVTAASWPSGHATAAMALALGMVIAVPARWRGWTAAVMAAFAVAVSYSFLELGWHYPSDVLGGFLVATVWALLGVAVLSIDAARRAAPAPSPRHPAGPAADGARAAAPRPGAGLVFGGAAVLAAMLCLLVGLARHTPLTYLVVHPAFALGAATIAALGVSLAGGLSLVLRRR